jgi:tetratricopeptide (TPR) repeat protein
MARISLRSYNREIENLIERGQIEEAIAHSKNILKQYPKHIETYRLLGKAFLESQRYSEASDILQRVLSVIPDDFVAQLGMSIIREDEANLDAAIWHMERAYEVQPFNRAVQDELRRLYGRRDGSEPPRVRLTRGSLVRMYARGELYPQAIAEIRAALAEDPHRLDLMVLLARMYFQSSQKVESAEIASNLIGKLPYCMEANHILMDILPGTNRADESRAFQRRIYDLDPYMEFITPNTPTSPQVPEQAVMVERVDWRPTVEENQTPDWTRTVGVNWEQETQEEALPDWLDNLAASPIATTRSQPNQLTTAEPQDEVLVPDFLRDAGWGVSDSNIEPTPPINTLDSETAEPLESSDIPDWLQSMAPVSNEPEQEPEKLDWLNSILPAASAIAVATATQTNETDQQESTEEISLDWLTSNIDQAPAETTASWMSTSIAPPPSGNEPNAVDDELATPTADAIPDWLRDLSADPIIAQDKQENTSDIPAWLRETDSAVEPETAETLGWLQDTISPQTSKQTGALPAWMQDDTPISPASDDIPEWLRDEPAMPDAVQGTASDFGMPQPSAIENTNDLFPSNYAPQEDDLTAWLNQLNAPEATPSPSAETESVETPQSIPENNFYPTSWALTEDTESAPEASSDLITEQEIAPTSVEAQKEEAGAIFIAEAQPNASKDIIGETEIPVAVVDANAMPDFSDMDAAMAWMEALAAKQGADSESLKITSPEQRSEAIPEWLAGLSQDEPQSIIEDAQPVDEQFTLATTEDDTMLPAWLRDDIADSSFMGSADTHSSDESLDLESTQLDDLPDWLNSADQNNPELTSSLEVESPNPDQAIEDTQPIKVISPPPIDEVTLSVTTDIQAEMPTAVIGTPKAEDLSAPDFNDMDATMAWLEALAARQGAEPESLKITAPDQRNETPPGWILGLTNQQSANPVEETVSDVNIPDWLKDDSPDIVEPVTSTSDMASNNDWVSEFPSAFDSFQSEPTTALISTTSSDEKSVPDQADDTPVGGLPAWLIEEQSTQKTETPVISSQSLASIPNLDDMDSTMAWLEALAAKQGADEATLKITSPELRSTTPPDWIAKLTMQANSLIPAEEVKPIPQQEEVTVQLGSTVVEPVENDLLELEETTVIASTPSVVKQAETEPVTVAVESKSPTEEEETIPPHVATTVVPPAEIVEPTAIDLDIPDWLLNFEQEQSGTKTGRETPGTPVATILNAADEDESITRWLQTHHPEPAAEPVEYAETAKPRTPQSVGSSLSEQAQTALGQGNIDQAMAVYSQIIQKGSSLDHVIEDLHNAADRYPVDPNIWQTLGDAYIRADRIQDALDAYSRAEELIR